MAVCEPLRGKYIDLLCAETSDAEFTLNIRNDSELTKYIPSIKTSISNQIMWINEQRNRAFDVFFVIKKKDGIPLGTISYYDFNSDNKSCEIGRYISHGNAFENIEAVLLMLDYLFCEYDLAWILLNIHQNNMPVISLWKRFGALFECEVQKDGWKSVQYHLTQRDYKTNRAMVLKLLRY